MPFQSLFFVGNQIPKLNDVPHQTTLQLMANLSTPVALPTLAAQSLNTMARLYTDQDKLNISFEFKPLPPNPVIATANPAIPPINAISYGSFLTFAMNFFARSDLFRLVAQRNSGVLRQYFNVGAPKSAFLTAAFVFQFLAIFISAVIFELCLQFWLPFEFSGITIIFYLSSLVIPIYNLYVYVTSTGQSD